MASTAILIPARYKSSRYPGKIFADLNRIPLIKIVYDKCLESKFDTFVLTDCEEVKNIIHKNVICEKIKCENGTDRCSKIIKKYNLQYDNFINVQGDMPDVSLDMIYKCNELLKKYPVSTVYADMDKKLKNNPNTVKLIRNNNECIWFGRGFVGYGDWHLGVYGYRKNAVIEYSNLEIFEEEVVENLEQLRWIKNDYKMGCSKVDFSGIEINTKEDHLLWNKRNEYTFKIPK